MTTEPRLPLADERHFWLRRLQSLTGLVPVGGFVALHLFGSLAARGGAVAYDERAERLTRIPGIALVEVLFVLLPIAFHAVVGLFMTSEAHPSTRRGIGSAVYLFQRASGVFLLFFVVFHVWTTRAVAFVDSGAHEALFELFAGSISNPIVLAITVAGVLAATAHLGCGLWTFLIRWGLAVGPRSRRIAAWASIGLFLTLATTGLVSLRAFLHADS